MYAKYARLRDKKGITDYKVSADTGISRTTLSEWKAAYNKGEKYNPKLDKLEILAKYFGVDVTYFLK